MEKALKRQAGAAFVNLDTEGQWAKIYFDQPRPIDFRAVVAAAESAAFPTVGLELAVAGEVVEAHCDHCSGQRRALQISPTGQELELAGDAWPLGTVVDTEFAVLGWEEEHVLLRPLDAAVGH